ncbi:MAG TPA: YncE family protein [Ktedonobacteraceae bacterium]|nr:YncE family protein [Ktedonobacteraceae bacterium]
MKIVYRVGTLILVLACFLLLLRHSQQANADGGAPNLAYVAGAQHGIGVVDISQQKVTSSIRIDGNPQMILLSLDGRYLYVTQPSLGRVATISARTGNIICTANLPGEPSLLALGPQSGDLYAAGNGASIVSILNPATCAILHSLQTQSPVYGIGVGLVGAGNDLHDQLWVSGSSSLTSFNPNGQPSESIPVEGGPQYLSLPGGYSLYMTTRQGNVDTLEFATRKVIPLVSGGTYGPMDYDSITGEIYVPDEKTHRLEILTPWTPGSPTPHEPNRIVHLSSSPQAVAVTSDGQLAFVALSEGKVVMMDVPGRTIINTINVGGDPRFIITGLYPPVLGTTPQETSTWKTLIDIAAGIILFVLVAGSFLLIRRNRALNRSTKTKET